MEKKRNFSSYPQYFRYISNFRSQISYTFVKCGCSKYFFLNSATLICRGTDILKYFRESLGIRDNESRLYVSDLGLHSLHKIENNDNNRNNQNTRKTEHGPVQVEELSTLIDSPLGAHVGLLSQSPFAKQVNAPPPV